MDVTQIPFAKHIRIQQNKNTLVLSPKEVLLNHIGSFHAGALFTLAETQSGLFLQTYFPQMSKDVIALLRSSTVTYKKPSSLPVEAYAIVDEEVLTHFKERFLKKGRATISIAVDIKDTEGILIMCGEFKWFVQKNED